MLNDFVSGDVDSDLELPPSIHLFKAKSPEIQLDDSILHALIRPEPGKGWNDIQEAFGGAHV